MYFLPLASFYISYMEKCGDIRLIDRLRIFMLFAILFCSLTLTDYSSSSSSSTHWAYPVLYVDVFSSSVLISESVFTSASEISASFSAVSDTFSAVSDTFLSDSSSWILVFIEDFHEFFSCDRLTLDQKLCCFVKNVHIFTNVCDCFGVSFF